MHHPSCGRAPHLPVRVALDRHRRGVGHRRGAGHESRTQTSTTRPRKSLIENIVNQSVADSTKLNAQQQQTDAQFRDAVSAGAR